MWLIDSGEVIRISEKKSERYKMPIRSDRVISARLHDKIKPELYLILPEFSRIRKKTFDLWFKPQNLIKNNTNTFLFTLPF